jgi:hypothetical protein
MKINRQEVLKRAQDLVDMHMITRTMPTLAELMADFAISEIDIIIRK